ncbi:lysis system i-spanin subunit Rz [Stenotrophomonas pigmentata]|uniref:lysis system i-spanin subunit Rz n=1 Tax=Stenotrophomonas pigmentata TaxID=3055080 RepID=UPI0026F0D1B0|nr:lysis system i-spanin subunit Rz [Stenotrophomonas sp. 610A2]
MNRVHILAGLLLFLAGCLFGREWRDRSADIAAGKEEVKQLTSQVLAEQGVRALEQTKGQELAKIGAKHEQDREAAEAVPAAVVADLRAGNLQLRRQWAACETNRVSESAAGIAERDALAELRAKDQGDLVRIGRDADDQVKACQASVRVGG